jgi:hypothetical protein
MDCRRRHYHFVFSKKMATAVEQEYQGWGSRFQVRKRQVALDGCAAPK